MSSKTGKSPVGPKASDVLARKIRREPELRIAIDAARKDRLRRMLASLMAEARTRGGFTQTRLAARARMWPSHISRLESGKDLREPSLSLLARLAEAMGYRLDLRLVPARKVG